MMIWAFLAGVLTTIVIFAMAVGCVVFLLKKNYLRMSYEQLNKATSSLTDLPKTAQTSAPLKAMTPYERSLEDSKEIKERVEYLLK